MKKPNKAKQPKTPEEIHSLIIAREAAAHKAELERSLEKIRATPKLDGR